LIQGGRGWRVAQLDIDEHVNEQDGLLNALLENGEEEEEEQEEEEGDEDDDDDDEEEEEEEGEEEETEFSRAREFVTLVRTRWVRGVWGGALCVGGVRLGHERWRGRVIGHVEWLCGVGHVFRRGLCL
jgi:hypothetical protein